MPTLYDRLLDDWAAWKVCVGTDGVNSPDPRHVPCLAIINPPLWELGLSGIRCGRRLSATAMVVGRGGSFATRSRMRKPRYRNCYEAHRDDIFVGFRSCLGD